MTRPSTVSELDKGAKAAADAAPLVDKSFPSIEECLAKVAEDVREVRKSGHNSSQNFNFRGIDAVVNAVGPAFRRHGVVCLPMVEDLRLEPMPLSGGKQATRVVVTVRYRFHGPNRDHLDAVSVGEAFDMGDKATAKAMSVAYRTCLLQALTIPTDDPDPDEQVYEQAAPAPAGWTKDEAKAHVLKLSDGDADLAKQAWVAIATTGAWTEAALTRRFLEWVNEPKDPEVTAGA